MILLICFCFCTLSCDGSLVRYSKDTFDYFDTVTTVIGYEESEADFERVCGEIFSLLGEYHKLFDIYNSYANTENLCTLNSSDEPVRGDPKIIDLLEYAKEMYTLTDGKMNVAMGSVLSIWHEYRENGISLPALELLADAAERTDIDAVEIDKENLTVTLADGVKLDVGAIAKGYAAEMTAKMLEEKGITGYIINIGGNVRTVGTRPDGTKWAVGIESPFDDADEPCIAYLELSGESLVTSGSYQRYYEVDGKRYHHIIDPETLLPADQYVSVSVVCSDSVLADALSTALFVTEIEKGLSLVESLEEAEAMWVYPDGTKVTSSGFDKYVKN